MMGGHHAVSGTAAWMALAGSAHVAGHATGLGLLQLTPGEVLAGAVVTTGAALLPDIDHPSGTIARSGGLSRILSSTVSSVAGHRGATHTPLAVLVFTALASLVAGLDWRAQVPVIGEVQAGAVVIVTVLCAVAARALKAVEGRLLPWIVGLGSGLVVAVLAPDTAIWLPMAIALGVLVHLAGDLVTTDGIPFPTWPLVLKPSRRTKSPMWHTNGNIALPVLGNAGSGREWAVCSALSLYALVTVGATLYAMVEPAAASW